MSQEKIINIYVFKNGDDKSNGNRMVVDRDMSWTVFLQDVTKSLQVSPDSIKHMYLADNGIQISSASDLRHKEKYVAAGTESFKVRPNGYKIIEEESVESVASSFTTKTLNNTHNIIIYIFYNGDTSKSPRKFVLTISDLDNWKITLSFIANVMNIISDISCLCTLEGYKIVSSTQLQNGRYYVAVPYHEKFKPKNYMAVYSKMKKPPLELLSMRDNMSITSYLRASQVDVFKKKYKLAKKMRSIPSKLKDTKSKDRGRTNNTEKEKMRLQIIQDIDGVNKTSVYVVHPAPIVRQNRNNCIKTGRTPMWNCPLLENVKNTVRESKAMLANPNAILKSSIATLDSLKGTFQEYQVYHTKTVVSKFVNLPKIKELPDKTTPHKLQSAVTNKELPKSKNVESKPVKSELTRTSVSSSVSSQVPKKITKKQKQIIIEAQKLKAESNKTDPKTNKTNIETAPQKNSENSKQPESISKRPENKKHSEISKNSENNNKHPETTIKNLENNKPSENNKIIENNKKLESSNKTPENTIYTENNSKTPDGNNKTLPKATKPVSKKVIAKPKKQETPFDLSSGNRSNIQPKEGENNKQKKEKEQARNIGNQEFQVEINNATYTNKTPISKEKHQTKVEDKKEDNDVSKTNIRLRPVKPQIHLNTATLTSNTTPITDNDGKKLESEPIEVDQGTKPVRPSMSGRPNMIGSERVYGKIMINQNDRDTKNIRNGFRNKNLELRNVRNAKPRNDPFQDSSNKITNMESELTVDYESPKTGYVRPKTADAVLKLKTPNETGARKILKRPPLFLKSKIENEMKGDTIDNAIKEPNKNPYSPNRKTDLGIDVEKANIIQEGTILPTSTLKPTVMPIENIVLPMENSQPVDSFIGMDVPVANSKPNIKSIESTVMSVANSQPTTNYIENMEKDISNSKLAMKSIENVVMSVTNSKPTMKSIESTIMSVASSKSNTKSIEKVSMSVHNSKRSIKSNENQLMLEANLKSTIASIENVTMPVANSYTTTKSIENVVVSVSNAKPSIKSIENAAVAVINSKPTMKSVENMATSLSNPKSIITSTERVITPVAISMSTIKSIENVVVPVDNSKPSIKSIENVAMAVENSKPTMKSIENMATSLSNSKPTIASTEKVVTSLANSMSTFKSIEKVVAPVDNSKPSIKSIENVAMAVENSKPTMKSIENMATSLSNSKPTIASTEKVVTSLANSMSTIKSIEKVVAPVDNSKPSIKSIEKVAMAIRNSRPTMKSIENIKTSLSNSKPTIGSTDRVATSVANTIITNKSTENVVIPVDYSKPSIKLIESVVVPTTNSKPTMQSIEKLAMSGYNSKPILSTENVEMVASNSRPTMKSIETVVMTVSNPKPCIKSTENVEIVASSKPTMQSIENIVAPIDNLKSTIKSNKDEEESVVNTKSTMKSMENVVKPVVISKPSIQSIENVIVSVAKSVIKKVLNDVIPQYPIQQSKPELLMKTSKPFTDLKTLISQDYKTNSNSIREMDLDKQEEYDECEIRNTNMEGEPEAKDTCEKCEKVMGVNNSDRNTKLSKEVTSVSFYANLTVPGDVIDDKTKGMEPDMTELKAAILQELPRLTDKKIDIVPLIINEIMPDPVQLDADMCKNIILDIKLPQLENIFESEDDEYDHLKA